MPSDVRAGGAYVELGLRSKIDAGLKSVQSRLAGFGKSVLAIGAAGFGAAATLIAPLVLTASQAQETMSKFATVFGESSNAMEAWSNAFASDVGRAKDEVAGFLASTQDLLVPMGLAVDTATDMSKTITALGIDLASFNNKTDAEAITDLQAALTGSGEVMKKYGVILSVATTNQELLNMALDPKTATEAQKAQARLNVIMKGTTAAQGDAIRTAGSFANQMKALMGSVRDTGVMLGNLFLPSITKIVTVVNRVVGAFSKFADGNKELFQTLAAVVLSIGAGGGAMVILGSIVSTLAAVMGPLITVVGAVVGFIATLSAPVLLVAGAIGVVVAAIGGGIAFTLFGDQLKGLGSQLWNFLGPVRQWASGFIDAVKAPFSPIIEFISGRLSVAANLVKTLLGPYKEIGGVIVDGIAAPFTALVGWLSGTLTSLGNDVAATFGGISAALSNGNISLAVEILWSEIILMWTEGTAKIQTLWLQFTGGIDEAWTSVMNAIPEPMLAMFGVIADTYREMLAMSDTIFGGIADAWAWHVNTMSTAFKTVMNVVIDVMQSYVSQIAAMMKTVGQYDPSGIATALAKQLDRASGSLHKFDTSLDQQSAGDVARSEQRLQRAKATEDKLADIQRQSAEARARRDALIQQALTPPPVVSPDQAAAIVESDKSKLSPGLGVLSAEDLQKQATTITEANPLKIPLTFTGIDSAKLNAEVLTVTKSSAATVPVSFGVLAPEKPKQTTSQNSLGVLAPDGNESGFKFDPARIAQNILADVQRQSRAATGEQTQSALGNQDEAIKAGESVKKNSGTFSAAGAALLGLGGNSVQDKIALHTERTKENTARMVDQLSDVASGLKNIPQPRFG